MTALKPTLHMLCGKIASGKSTLAAELASRPDTILISEDEWLGVLFGDEMTTVKDFVKYSAKLRDIVGPHVSTLLKAGVSVVLDFHANTLENRRWMRSIFENADAAHQLHWIDVTNDICLARLQARNDAGDHPFAASKEDFERVTQHFVPPSPDEEFNIVMHG